MEESPKDRKKDQSSKTMRPSREDPKTEGQPGEDCEGKEA